MLPSFVTLLILPSVIAILSLDFLVELIEFMLVLINPEIAWPFLLLLKLRLMLELIEHVSHNSLLLVEFLSH